MLYEILSKIVNMSMTASIVIAAVLLLRLVLKKAPKIYSYLLWFIVLFRLLCPVSISSAVSLIGMLDTPVTEEGMIAYLPYADNSGKDIPAVNLGTMADRPVSPEIWHGEEPETAYEPWEILAGTGAVLWVAGVAAMLLCSAVSLVKLKKRLVGSVKASDRIYRADHIVTPFVMGIVYPRIYLPSNLSETEKNYILLHEKHHIRRGDHIFKILFYTALCVHWFNPLVWMAFYLFVKDMEMSCDEAVMNRMASDIRAEYSQSLLCLATGRRMVTGMPLAFGEGDTGDRIKNILKWKKPKAWVAAAAVVLCVTAAVCLITNPATSDSDEEIAFYAENGDENASDVEIGNENASGEDVTYESFDELQWEHDVIAASQEYNDELIAIQEQNNELIAMQEEIDKEIDKYFAMLAMMQGQNDGFIMWGEIYDVIMALQEYNNELMAMQEENNKLMAMQEENNELMEMLQKQNDEIIAMQEQNNNIIGDIQITIYSVEELSDEEYAELNQQMSEINQMIVDFLESNGYECSGSEAIVEELENIYGNDVSVSGIELVNDNTCKITLSDGLSFYFQVSSTEDMDTMIR